MKLYTEEMAVEVMMQWARNVALPPFDSPNRCPDGVSRRVSEMKAEITNWDATHITPLTIDELYRITGPFMCDYMICDQCGERSKQLVKIDQPDDYESTTARLCKGCVEAAFGMFK